uniref:Uncharacterized protein n=1 Tax=Anopheles maculatus TaxID=74869 RepID=A0A182SVP8_9DIPT
MPVKMQETLEEIYLASLSKLDTRSSSLIDLTNLSSSTETVDASGSSSTVPTTSTQLGKVLEEPEGDVQQKSSSPSASSFAASSRNGDSVELTLQPFQAPQQPKQQTPKVSPTRQTKDSKATSIPSAKTTRKENNPMPAPAPTVSKTTTTPTMQQAKSMNGPVNTAANLKAGSQVNLATSVQAAPPSIGTPTASRKVISSVQISLKQSAASAATPPEPSTKQRDSTISTDSSKPAATKLPLVKQIQSEPKPASPTKTSAVSIKNVKKSEETLLAPKSAFTAVSKDPLSQKSISMLELHRTPTVTKQDKSSETSAILCNGLATPTMTRKQQPTVHKEANKPTASTIVPQQIAAPVVKHLKTAQKDGNKPTKPQIPCTPTPQEPREMQQSIVVVSDKNSAEAEGNAKPVPPHHTRSRTLSSDEQCFEELRKKHEAIFANQEIVKPLASNPDAATPKTLSDVRNSLLAAQQPTATVSPAALEMDERIDPHYREGINQLMMELMPGVALDDDVPIPKQRQKSSFHKELQKLQRAKSSAVVGPSAEQAKPTPTNNNEYKMEVIRTANTTKTATTSSVEKRQGSEEKMQIRLERSTQIKEQYAKKPMVMPTIVSSTASTSSGKKQSFVMPNVPSDIDKHRGILSRDTVTSKKQEIEDFDDLLEKIDADTGAAVDIDLDELLSDADEVPKKNVAKVAPGEIKNLEKKSEVSGALKQGQSKLESKTSGGVDNKVVESTDSKAPVANVNTNSGVKTESKPEAPAMNKQGPAKMEAKNVTINKTVESTSPKTPVSNVKSVSNPISEAMLNETISQLTEKMNQSRINAPKPSSPRKQEERSKDMFTKLFNTTDASQTDLDLFEELCKKEDPEPKQNRSDLVDSSTIARRGSPTATIMPDVISSTKKPSSIAEPKAMQILECIDSLKQGCGTTSMKMDS